ncbi:MAG: restriction endonuclease subunit S [Acutalibacteraceae bacterium]|nr:restriction endonuclease subunit S [Acutalibacteraceae bacterium]
MRCEWKTIKAEDFCYSVTDGTHDSPKGKENGHYLITSKHLAPYAIDFSSAKRISEEDYKKVIKRSPVEQWDILFSMIGTIGITYLEKNSDIDYACKNMGIFKFNGDKEKAYWLYYFLQTPQAKEYILGHLRGTTQQYLPLGSLRDFPIQVAPTETRERITAILRDIDDQIAVNTAINENLEKQAQAIFKSLFVDFEPFSGIMPDDWNTGNLGSFVTIKRGGSPRPIQNYLSETGYRWLKISDVTSLNSPFILDIKEHIIESGLKKTVFLKQGALVLSNSATPGIPKILDVDSCIHDGWLYFPESKLSNEYLYLLFKFIRKDLVALGNGSVFTNLKTDILKQYEISLPSERVLNDFQTVISPLFEAMRNIARENKSLAALRDTLLPKLMNGEIDVSPVQI